MRGHIEDPQVSPSAAAGGDEDNVFSIRREAGLIIVGGVVGQPFQPGAIGMNAVKIGRACTFRGENDPIAFR